MEGVLIGQSTANPTDEEGNRFRNQFLIDTYTFLALIVVNLV